MSFSETLDILLYIFQPALMFSEQELSKDVAHQSVDECTLRRGYGKNPTFIKMIRYLLPLTKYPWSWSERKPMQFS